MSLSAAEREEFAALLSEIDTRHLAEMPDGFMRPAFPGEDELLGMPNLLGVIYTPTAEGFVCRFGFGTYADIANIYEGEPPWTPLEVAEHLGCTLVDLGVIREAS